MRRNLARGFTLIELLVVISIIALLISILLPSLGKAKGQAKQLKDSTHIRGIHQSLVVWGSNNQGSYPLPSRVDAANRTMLASNPFEKDNTGNIMSLLVFQGFVPVQLLVNPAENNPFIAPDTLYQDSAPDRAVDPDGALWDPGLAGVMNETGSGMGPGGRRSAFGNVSYAHLPPFGQRTKFWADSYNFKEAVLSNRGPEYGGQPGSWLLAPGATGQGSNTLPIFGGPTTWEGNVAYNDGRVAFEGHPDPVALSRTYRSEINGQRTHGDNIFVNEDDEFGIPIRTDATPSLGANVLLRSYSDVRAAGTEVDIEVMRD